MPGMTHWNHPGFMAYFSITASAPGVLADFIASALNQQAMLWRTSPSATELEAVVMGWLRPPHRPAGRVRRRHLRHGVDLQPPCHRRGARGGRAAACARAASPGRADVPRLRVYCSDQAHSSIDKGVILAGLGQEALRKIPTDAEYRMRPDALRAAIAEDRAAGVRPIAVVATVGTTSTTSVDPVAAIADVCEAEGLWLHVDSAYAGVAAMLPEHAHILAGADRADSLVVNPHKWLFTPFDLSAFFCRRMDVVRQAFSLAPDYLKTPDAARNLMDTGVQLGRRFRSLKLWMILRYFGAEGVRERLRYHIDLAQQFAGWVDADPDFERLAPAPFSVVCFRAKPAGREWTEAELARLNEAILTRVNDSGEIFISHTVLRGRFTLRVAIGNLQTTDRHVRRAWELVREALAEEARRPR